MASGSQVKDAYDRDGFMIVRQFLSVDEITELQEQLDRYIRDVVPTRSLSDVFYQEPSRPETLKQMQHMEHDPFFGQYVHHPKWVAMAETLCGEAATCQSPEWFNKPPGVEHPTPPHQDNYYFNLVPPNVVTLWLALDPVDDENGCLRYVTGSHRRGIRPHNATKVLGFSQGITDYDDDDRAQEAVIHLAPGDLVAHHGETIHRAEPNRSTDRHRRAFAMVFRGVSCRRDEDRYRQYEDALKSQHTTMGLQS